MTNLQKVGQINQVKSSTLLLDTLAQLSTKPLKLNDSKDFQNKKLTKETLQKRAKSKAFTLSYLFDLIDLKSDLNKSYWQTYHCSSAILQEGKTLTSRYCNQRWCLTCNRIRTAKIINGYKKEIDLFEEPQFVTLTSLNVKGYNLRGEIESMNKTMSKISNNLKRRHNVKLKALRKYECTYNKVTNEYHPHFHLILEGKDNANILVNEWLKHNKTSKSAGQDIQEADSGTMTELCKYFTKIVGKESDYNPKALDIMFKASKGKRTFQPMGIKKDVCEDIEEIEKQEANFLESREARYVYHNASHDWICEYGVLLSEYEPTKEELKFINGEYKNQKSYDNKRG